MNDAQSLMARTRWPTSTQYTPEVNELYKDMLAQCKALSDYQFIWHAVRQWPFDCSNLTFTMVIDRFRNERFTVRHFGDIRMMDAPVIVQPYVPYSIVIDWSTVCTIKCDAQDVQLLHTRIKQEAVEAYGQYVYNHVLGLCNRAALLGDSSYALDMTYVMNVQEESGMHPILRAPVEQLLIKMLNDQGFATSTPVCSRPEIIDIRW